MQDKNRKLRPLYDIPYMFEAREFLRKKLIGKKVWRGAGAGGEVLAHPRCGWSWGAPVGRGGSVPWYWGQQDRLHAANCRGHPKLEHPRASALLPPWSRGVFWLSRRAVYLQDFIFSFVSLAYFSRLV